MKPPRPRYLPVWPGFADGPTWLFSPPEENSVFFYSLPCGALVPPREPPLAFMDTTTHTLIPTCYFVLKPGAA